MAMVLLEKVSKCVRIWVWLEYDGWLSELIVSILIICPVSLAEVIFGRWGNLAVFTVAQDEKEIVAFGGIVMLDSAGNVCDLEMA